MAQCKRHPQVETSLYCSKCEEPICPRCMVQTPVGARCSSCARLNRLPTYRLSPVYYLRALGAAILLAAGTGLAWGFIKSFLPFGFFNILLGAAVGYGIAEGLSLAVNRKRGISLCIIAGTAVIVAYLI